MAGSSVRRGRRALGALVAAMVMVAVCATTPAAAANDGERCKKNGWVALRRADGTTFKNQGQCVSFAVQGGTFLQDLPELCNGKDDNGNATTDEGFLDTEPRWCGELRRPR